VPAASRLEVFHVAGYQRVRQEGASAHCINKALKRKGHVWQDESFDHVARCEDSLQQRIEYVGENPVKAGLVPRPEELQMALARARRGTAGGGGATQA
jgi:REP element-mobilizing transposase RayT